MDIVSYLQSLNEKSQEIFQKSLENKQSFGEGHHLASCIQEFSLNIQDESERKILNAVCIQLESANLSATHGFYRQAFSSLRLAFEMGLGSVYLSSNKLELNEWLSGCNDIRWCNLIDENNGVLSKRFVTAFFGQEPETLTEYRDRAIREYRKLSEYVHGNNETWEKSGSAIAFNLGLLSSFFESFFQVSEITLYTLTCRYLRTFSNDQKDALPFLSEQFTHITEFHQYLGAKER